MSVVRLGLVLLPPVPMAQTPASMCTPLKTIKDSLSHRRRYMVRELVHLQACLSEHGTICTFTMQFVIRSREAGRGQSSESECAVLILPRRDKLLLLL